MPEPGIEQVIRMVLDEQSRRAAEKGMQDTLAKGTDPDKAKANVRDVDNAFERMGKTVRRVAEYMIARALIRSVVGFARESVAAALDAQKEWDRLSGTLDNVGVSFDRVGDEVRKLAGQFQDAGVMGDEEFASALATLTQMSGDYEKSLRNMGVVADVMIGKKMGLEEASMLVGKAMVGETGRFKQYGIEVKAGADAVQVLNDKFGGLAMAQDVNVRQAKSFSESWGDLKEAFGDALLAFGKGEGIMGSLTGLVKNFTATIKNNASGISALGRVMWWLVRLPGAAALGLMSGLTSIVTAGAQAYTWLAKGIDWAMRVVGKGSTTLQSHVEEMEKFVASGNAAALAAHNLSLALMGVGAPPGATAANTSLPGGPVGGAVRGAKGEDGGAKGEKEEEHALDERIDVLTRASDIESMRAQALEGLKAIEQELRDELEKGNLSMKERVHLNEDLQTVVDATSKAIKAMSFESELADELLGTLHGGMAGWASGILAALAKEAQGRALWNIAKAIEMKAIAAGAAASAGLGNPFAAAAAAAALVSAKGHAAAAAKWGLVAGGVAAIGSMGSGGGGSKSSTDRIDNAGNRDASGVKVPGVVVTIHVDGIDPGNTRHQAKVQQINRQVKERYGEDSRIEVLAGTGGRR